MASITHRSGQLVDQLLTNLSVKYTPTGFVADKVCPRVTVKKEAGKYTTWDRAALARTDTNPLLPDRAETKDIDFEAGEDSYSCEEYALRTSVSRREIDNTDDILDLRQTKSNGVRDIIALHREVRVADLLTEAGGLAAGDAPSNNWNVDAATIEGDVVVGKEATYDATGLVPNTIIIPWKVANAIAIQQEIREILKYTVNGQELLRLGEKALPDTLWGLKVEVPMGPAFTNSAEGDATPTFEEVWGDDVRILYLHPAPRKENPSVAYTFQTRGVEVKSWHEDDPEVERIRVSDGVLDEKIVAAGAGYEIQNVLS
jgi:hypothetical protein